MDHPQPPGAPQRASSSAGFVASGFAEWGTPSASVRPLTSGGPLLASAPFSMKRVISTKDAPAAVGPYSQAIAIGDLLFCAGQIPLDPRTNTLVESGISGQTKCVLENVRAVLAANEMTFTDVVKATVFLTDLNDFAAMNTIYAGFFTEPFPARSTVQVAALPRGASVEIEVIAARTKS